MCKDEDPTVQTLEVLADSKTVGAEVDLHALLSDTSKRVSVRINNTEYAFANKVDSDYKEMASKSEHKWQDSVKNIGLDGIHASTISTALQLTEQALLGTKSKLTSSDIMAAFKSQSMFFENAVVREEIYKLNAIRVAASNELEQLKARKAQIDKIEQSKNMRVFSLMSLWFTFQFGISYYTIYEVDWLGWDLVEPFTYSISQGTALFGVWFVMRNRGSNTAYTDLADHMKRKRQRRWLKKYEFDL